MGNQIDALIARHFLGESEAAPYSTSYQHAGVLVAELNRRGFGVSMDEFPDKEAAVSILERVDDGKCWEASEIARGEGFPQALCFAILQLLDIEH